MTDWTTPSAQPSDDYWWTAGCGSFRCLRGSPGEKHPFSGNHLSPAVPSFGGHSRRALQRQARPRHRGRPIQRPPVRPERPPASRSTDTTPGITASAPRPRSPARTIPCRSSPRPAPRRLAPYPPCPPPRPLASPPPPRSRPTRWGFRRCRRGLEPATKRTMRFDERSTTPPCGWMRAMDRLP